MADPKLVLPPPAPQSEAEGLKNPDTPVFSPAPNPITGKVGGGDPVRRDESRARHPLNKRFTS